MNDVFYLLRRTLVECFGMVYIIRLIGILIVGRFTVLDRHIVLLLFKQLKQN
jgi:hypothetical protein